MSQQPAIPPFGITGDWFGARDALFDAGIDLRTNLSQFYQGVTSGGLRQTFPYGLKFDYFGTIEGEKLVGWEGLFVNLHGESRFGQSVNRDVGSLVPANFALEFPKPAGSASALTNMQIEQFLGPDFVVTFGKLNAADGVNIHPFLGGNGINRFMNEAFVLSPLYGRLIPYSTPGAGFSYLRDFDPVFTFLVLDTNGRPDTSGVSHMFSNGATLFASLRVPVTPFGLPGHQSLEAGYASGRFSPLSPDDYIILPGISAQRRTGSWLVTYGFDQFLVIDPDDPTKGWGIFANISLADQTTNPVHWFLNLGVGGESPIPGRSADSFGVGYYYLATSSVLRQTLGPVAPIAQRAGLRALLQRRDHQLVHPDGRHPGHRPRSGRCAISVPFWSEGEDRLLARGRPDQPTRPLPAGPAFGREPTVAFGASVRGIQSGGPNGSAGNSRSARIAGSRDRSGSGRTRVVRIGRRP